MVTNRGYDMKQGNLCLVSACAVMLCGFLASSQAHSDVYRWTDENGVTHFSETPPPGGQEAQVEDIPDGVPGPVDDESGIDPASVMNDNSVPSDQAAADTMSPADLKRQAMAEKRAQRQADQKALEAECRQVKSRLAQIEPSRRVYYVNEEGETVRMDDEQRVGEVDELQDFIDKNCSK